jgi:hypothetical protein
MPISEGGEILTGLRWVMSPGISLAVPEEAILWPQGAGHPAL